VSRHTVDRIVFAIGAEEFEFTPDMLAHLPTVDEAGAEPGTALWEILSVMEDALAPGQTVRFGPEHVTAVAEDLQDFARTYLELSSKDRLMLAAAERSSRN